MKFSKIVFFFCFALPVSIISRVLQLIYTTDYPTGFIKRGYENMSLYLTLIIATACIVMAVLALTTRRYPKRAPKPNTVLSITAIFLSLVIFTEVFNSPVTATQWQSLFLYVSGIAAAAFFLAFAIFGFLKRKFPPTLAIIPVFYLLAKIIDYFTLVSTLAFSMDNIMILFSYCVMLIFMFNLAKLYNKIGNGNTFKRIMPWGFVAAILCFTIYVSQKITDFLMNNEYQYINDRSGLTFFAFGVFIMIFTFYCFSVRNIGRRDESRNGTKKENS